MTVIRLTITSCLLALFVGSACKATESFNMNEREEVYGAINKKNGSFIIDSQTGSVAGVFIGMTEAQIRESGWPFETRLQILEGDEYTVYDIRLAEGVYLKCIIYPENTVYSIESSTSGIKDQYELGVGSKLSELKNSYPSGRLISGNAEGRYASFVTGTRLIFRFNHNDLDESCFDHRQKCIVDENIMVEVVDIGHYFPE